MIVESKNIDMTNALNSLEIALSDVDSLLKHHEKRAPGAARRPGPPSTDERPLIRSSVVLMYAAWEVYIEDGLIQAIEKLVINSTPSQLPGALRTFVRKFVEQDPWKLAGEDWRKATVEAVEIRVHGNPDSGSFGMNNANPKQINLLHRDVLGVLPLGSCKAGKWDVIEQLQELVDMRNDIAHTGQLSKQHRLDLLLAESWRSFVQQLGAQLDEKLELWVSSNLN
jgi:RiboL-PSP-HEPN